MRTLLQLANFLGGILVCFSITKVVFLFDLCGQFVYSGYFTDGRVYPVSLPKGKALGTGRQYCQLRNAEMLHSLQLKKPHCASVLFIVRTRCKLLQ